jgi:hypothetical protein
MMAAPLARISALGLDAKPLGRALALGTSKALPEPDFKEVRQARLIVRVEFEELSDCQGLAPTPFYSSSFYVCKGDIFQTSSG